MLSDLLYRDFLYKLRTTLNINLETPSKEFESSLKQKYDYCKCLVPLLVEQQRKTPIHKILVFS